MTDTAPVIRDTHIWIWVMNGESKKLRPEIKDIIEKASEHSLIRVPSISVWEVGMLEAKNRISFQIPVIQWIHNALSAPGAELVPQSPEIAIESTRLPGNFHGDPADRMIVSTARNLDGLLITADHRIKEYASKGHVRVA